MTDPDRYDAPASPLQEIIPMADLEALARKRAEVAERVEGDSDNPLRVRRANEILAGKWDHAYAELAAFRARTDQEKAG